MLAPVSLATSGLFVSTRWSPVPSPHSLTPSGPPTLSGGGFGGMMDLRIRKEQAACYLTRFKKSPRFRAHHLPTYLHYYHILRAIKLFHISLNSDQSQAFKHNSTTARQQSDTQSGFCGCCGRAVVKGGMSVGIGAVRSPQRLQRLTADRPFC